MRADRRVPDGRARARSWRPGRDPTADSAGHRGAHDALGVEAVEGGLEAGRSRRPPDAPPAPRRRRRTAATACPGRAGRSGCAGAPGLARRYRRGTAPAGSGSRRPRGSGPPPGSRAASSTAEMNVFVPRRMYLPLSRLAAVEMLCELEPASGSVIANATLVVPAAIPGSQLFLLRVGAVPDQDASDDGGGDHDEQQRACRWRRAPRRPPPGRPSRGRRRRTPRAG